MVGVAEPPAPGEWPEVRAEGSAPPPDNVSVEEGTVLLCPPEVIAHGLVAGIPWNIQAWSTAPAPGAKWWEVMVAVGPEMEFTLGARGFLGGGGIHVRIPEGHFFTASGHFCGRVPYVISWSGVVAEEVERLEVALRDGRTKDVPLQDGPEGIPRFFWFFPPRGVPAEIVAYGPSPPLPDPRKARDRPGSPLRAPRPRPCRARTAPRSGLWPASSAARACRLIRRGPPPSPLAAAARPRRGR